VARSRRPRSSRPTLLILILVSVTLLTLGFGGTGPVSGLRSGFATAFRPVRSAADAAARPVANGWKGATRYGEVKKENERLRRQLDRLQGDRMRDDLLQQQVRELKRMLGVSFTRDLPTVTARVVSGPLSSFERTLEIDRGSGDGVKKGMAVVTDAGLAGKVMRADAGRSVVALITDPSFDVGIQVRPGGDIGIAHGNGLGKPLTVDEGIERGAKVAKGNAVYTSGVDRSAFPPDVPIGRVTTVRPSGDTTQKVLQVEPIADLGSLTYLKVIIRDPS